MGEFNYKNGLLHCEGMPVNDIAEEYPTPFYLYSYKAILDRFMEIKKAFKKIDPLICFSMKSNSNLNICRALVNAGSGLDIVSGGELYKALKVGCPPERIVYASYKLGLKRSFIPASTIANFLPVAPVFI